MSVLESQTNLNKIETKSSDGKKKENSIKTQERTRRAVSRFTKHLSDCMLNTNNIIFFLFYGGHLFVAHRRLWESGQCLTGLLKRNLTALTLCRL